MGQTVEITIEAQSMVRAARLRYGNDGEAGYTRKRWGRGFSYFDPQGKRVTDPDLRRRFESLVIPPAWEEVWIDLSGNGHIQATGRDDQGRKQYIYHPRWEEVRDEVKFNRLIAFGRGLPDLRMKIDEDLGGRQLLRDRIVALVLRLLDESLIRVGNGQYAAQYGSYGMTTLLKKHVTVSGSTMTFAFPGKGRKKQQAVVKDHRLARLVSKCQELPGQTLFQYLDDGGEYRPITSTEVNGCLQEVTGQPFTAKDFRTWGARSPRPARWPSWVRPTLNRTSGVISSRPSKLRPKRWATPRPSAASTISIRPSLKPTNPAICRRRSMT